MTSPASQVLLGLSILGSNDPTIAALLLMGKYDEPIKAALYFTWNKKYAEGVVEDQKVIDFLETIKDGIRRGIAQFLNEETAAQSKALLEKLKQTNKPHELGTVSEIATRYGISKSEVRRRKADGTLESYLNELEPKG